MVPELMQEVRRTVLMVLDNDETALLARVNKLCEYGQNGQTGVSLNTLQNRNVSVFLIIQLVARLEILGCLNKKVIDGDYIISVSELGKKYLGGENVHIMQKRMMIIKSMKLM